MRAYALMCHATELEASYLASPVFERARDHLDALRSKLVFVPFSAYRGIGRYPFSEMANAEPGWQWAARGTVDAEPRARQLLERLLGPYDFVTAWPRAFLPEPDQAKQVREALLTPTRYEIVEVCTPPDHPRRLFGFDIGYWGGGNFSILCDAAIWPLWHPPVVDSFTELAEVTRQLNGHALFPSVRAAQRYLDWYSRQGWAETEPEKFIVVGVGAWDA